MKVGVEISQGTDLTNCVRLVGGIFVMMASTCTALSEATVAYAEWCTALGITVFVYLSSGTEQWLAAICIGEPRH